jgi:hypothetical protein
MPAATTVPTAYSGMVNPAPLEARLPFGHWAILFSRFMRSANRTRPSGADVNTALWTADHAVDHAVPLSTRKVRRTYLDARAAVTEYAKHWASTARTWTIATSGWASRAVNWSPMSTPSGT